MLVEERRAKILQITEEMGYISLQQLVTEVGASESTIRRDLDYLDSTGQIQRTRGGACYAGDSLTDFDARIRQATAEKQSIARRAAELIEPGETVLLDGGTTTLEVARYLTGKPLQVLTNSVPIASLLMNRDGVELIFIGGYVYPRTGVALGELAVQALGRVNPGRLVMSTGGITEEGLFNSNALLVETERRMIAVSERVMLVADSSMFGRRALAHLCDLSQVDELVTDEGLTDEWKQVLDRAGIVVEMARPAGREIPVAG